jgi:hypothetical protein
MKLIAVTIYSAKAANNKVKGYLCFVAHQDGCCEHSRGGKEGHDNKYRRHYPASIIISQRCY